MRYTEQSFSSGRTKRILVQLHEQSWAFETPSDGQKFTECMHGCGFSVRSNVHIHFNHTVYTKPNACVSAHTYSNTDYHIHLHAATYLQNTK